MGVLVSSGCHNKILQSRWLKQRAFFFFFPHSSGGCKSKIRAPAWSDLDDSPLSGLQTAAFLLCLTCKAEVSSSSNKSANPIMGALPLGSLNYLPRALPPNNITLGSRVSTYEREGGETQTFSP